MFLFCPLPLPPLHYLLPLLLLTLPSKRNKPKYNISSTPDSDAPASSKLLYFVSSKTKVLLRSVTLADTQGTTPHLRCTTCVFQATADTFLTVYQEEKKASTHVYYACLRHGACCLQPPLSLTYLLCWTGNIYTCSLTWDTPPVVPLCWICLRVRSLLFNRGQGAHHFNLAWDKWGGVILFPERGGCHVNPCILTE